MTHSGEIARSSWISTLASTAVVIAALYLAKSLLVPLTLAVLLSFLLMPVCHLIERWGLGRTPAVLVTAILGFTFLATLTWAAVVQITHLAPKIPEYQDNIEIKLSALNQYAVAALNKLTKQSLAADQGTLLTEQPAEPIGTVELPYFVRNISPPRSPLEIFSGIFGTLLETLGTIGIVVVLVVFFLIRREDLRDRFVHLAGKGHVTVTTQMLEDANARVSRYVTMLLIVNVTFGIAVGIGLYLIGVPSAILWGILATALRFIPYIGPWIAAAMPIALAMAISTGWLAPLLTAGLFVVLELISNNVLEPWLYGKNTGVSAVAVLVGAVFWMWLWGPVGLLLATPLTVCLLVVGKHVPQLSFLNVLLGNEPVFEPQQRIYQRLLAGDQEEADELIEGLLTLRPLIEVYDTALIPALASVEMHWHRGELSDDKHRFILDSLKEMIQDRVDRQQEARAQETMADGQESIEDSTLTSFSSVPKLGVLSLPARSEADELAAMMLAQVLESNSCVVKTVPVMSLASDIVELVEHRRADVVCISATPPAALMHARYVCKHLRRRFPTVQLVVGLWDVHVDLNKAIARIGCNATVVETLADAQVQIRLLIKRRLAQTEQLAPL